VSAFFYLSWTIARNRFAFQIKRIRTPRYAAALIVGVLYIYSFLLRPGVRGAAGTMFLGRQTEMIAALLLLLTMMGAWVFGSDLTALAFTPAELSFLFPAPLSRRQLIGYKLSRAQVGVIVNALIWVFLLKRGGTLLAGPLRAVAIWAMFSTLSLHRLGAALVRSSWGEHGASGAKRNAVSIVVFAGLVALLVAGLIMHRAELRAVDGFESFFTVLARVLSSPPAYVALYPFHLAVAPTFAQTTHEWARDIGPAVAIIALHAWWVFRTDTAFEDAAITASAERAKRLEARIARRSTTAVARPRRTTSTFRLAARGHPAVAIFWKNMLCLRRTAQVRLFVGPAAMAAALGAAFNSGRADVGGFIAITATIFAGMLLMLGGRLVRNDLRHDMLHLPLIKSLPISSAHVVVAEVASSAIPMAAVQLVLVVAAYIASVFALDNPLAPDVRLAIVLSAPFAVFALNGALLAIQNATAVLFPAWMRLGASANTGVEALGQNVLGLLANLVALGVGLIVPAGIAWGAVKLFPEPRTSMLVTIAIIGSIVLAVETYGAMVLVGRALTRAEPLPQ